MAVTLNALLPGEGRGFRTFFVKKALSQVLLGLEYLHGADVIHTDFYLDNLLVSVSNQSFMSTVEEEQLNRPSARKCANARTVHVSQMLLAKGCAGPLTICDFGQARIGKTHRGRVMPTRYRAPEVILDMEWGSRVDLWNVGLIAWDLLETHPLFRIYDEDSEDLNGAHHLAAMTALLGSPPAEFLKRSEKTAIYWDKDGNWKGPVPLPLDLSFEKVATALSGEEQELFFNFVEMGLWWVPEERLDALHMYFHPWLENKRADETGEGNGT
ncbi:hypothetical protein NPX13_g1323 [Xylaria arbuscula]|uniref:Protein kinase domain-containing protein n=1 Tax=Xylaria arbuscula TaxID=114810 RepID=A0A9W8TQA3_9PEZI|nr:hypothetical protein NPX13_g1323 [Xylaria arbuscula]